MAGHGLAAWLTAARWTARLAAGMALLAALPAAWAASVSVVGLFPGKALVSINGGAPRTLAVGQKTPDGVTLVAAAADSATFDIGGQRRVLRMGEAFTATGGAGAAPASAPAGGASVALAPDGAGHYITVGAINERAVKFFVDTGASLVWMSAEVANRVGIDYRRGAQFTVTTAGGPKPAFAVKLASVRVGGITLTDVDGAVGEGAGTGETVLLGMSFLSRLSMTRDGNLMRLSRSPALAANADQRPSLTLTQVRAGMFATPVAVNGVSLPFLIDTGATNVALDVAMAQKIGINYQKGTPGMANTANGPVRAWRVKLDQVSAGPITLYNVDATVLEGPGIGVGLLGMSFLNRVEIKREGETMVLVKRF